jgi:hypothetical protein
MTDLWGDIPSGKDLISPHSILVAQASLLAGKTDGLLVGRALRSSDNDHNFTSLLQIIAPTLNNYSYSVCAVTYDVTLWPAKFASYSKPTWPDWVSCPNAESLKMRLGAELHSEEVRRVLAGLSAQIRADE